MGWPDSLLIVDDQAGVREDLIRLFAEAGIRPSEVWQAHDVAAACRLFDEHAPDLTLVDIILIGESGFDVVRHIRERDADAPVIMITAYPQLDYALDAIRIHADHFLVKPVTVSQLDAALLDLAGARRGLPEADGQRLSYRVLNRILKGREDLSSLETVKKKLGMDRLPGPEWVFAVAEAGEKTTDSIRDQFTRQGTPALIWQHDEGLAAILFSHDPAAGGDPVRLLDLLLRRAGTDGYRAGLSRCPRETALGEMYRRACFALKYARSRGVEGIPVRYEQLDLTRVIVTDCHAALMEAFDRRSEEDLRDALREMSVTLRRCGLTEGPVDAYNEMLSIEGLPPLDPHGDGSFGARALGHFRDTLGTLAPMPRALRMGAVRRCLLSTLSGPADQEALSAICGISYGYVSSLFSQYTGRGLNDYHRSARLRLAAELLRSTDLKVMDIARLTAFDTNKHFYGLFQTAYGLAPAPYHDAWVQAR